MRWSIILTLWSTLYATGCVTPSGGKKSAQLPPPPECTQRPRVRDYCLGELYTGEDCMVCNNQRGCLDTKRSAYCVNADFCDDPRCSSNGQTRSNGLLISE